MAPVLALRKLGREYASVAVGCNAGPRCKARNGAIRVTFADEAIRGVKIACRMTNRLNMS